MISLERSRKARQAGKRSLISKTRPGHVWRACTWSHSPVTRIEDLQDALYHNAAELNALALPIGYAQALSRGDARIDAIARAKLYRILLPRERGIFLLGREAFDRKGDVKAIKPALLLRCNGTAELCREGAHELGPEGRAFDFLRPAAHHVRDYQFTAGLPRGLCGA